MAYYSILWEGDPSSERIAKLLSTPATYKIPLKTSETFGQYTVAVKYADNWVQLDTKLDGTVVSNLLAASTYNTVGAIYMFKLSETVGCVLYNTYTGSTPYIFYFYLLPFVVNLETGKVTKGNNPNARSAGFTKSRRTNFNTSDVMVFENWYDPNNVEIFYTVYGNNTWYYYQAYKITDAPAITNYVDCINGCIYSGAEEYSGTVCFDQKPVNTFYACDCVKSGLDVVVSKGKSDTVAFFPHSYSTLLSNGALNNPTKVAAFMPWYVPNGTGDEDNVSFDTWITADGSSILGVYRTADKTVYVITFKPGTYKYKNYLKAGGGCFTIWTVSNAKFVKTDLGITDIVEDIIL